MQPRQKNCKNNEYALTLYQFNVLSQDEKAAVLWSKGDVVGENKISRLRSFSSTEQLEPYLRKIDISELFT